MRIKKKKNDNFAVYSFPYQKKDRRFLRMFSAKALLAFITCFYGAHYFTEMLNVKEHVFASALTAGLTCVFYMIMLGLFGRGRVLLFSLAAFLLPGKKMLEWGFGFFGYVLRVADGSIIDADKFIKDGDAQADPFPFILVLCAIFGILFAVSCYQRFSPEIILTYLAIMSIPSFLSQHTAYKPSLGVFAAGVIAMWSASMAFSSGYFLTAGGVTNVSLMDRQYRESVKKASPAKKIKSDDLHFNRYFSDSVVMFVSFFLIFSVTAACFPLGGNLRLDRLTEKVSVTVQGLGEWGSEFFASVNPSPFKGFFSADGGSINISNGINPKETSGSNTPVLEVTVREKDKLYLRGDIGYEFDGKRWKSISEINYNNISYYNTGAVNIDAGVHSARIPISETLADYTPEIEYYLASRIMEQRGGEEYGENPFIKNQSVKIGYLQRLNTVLFAGIPLIYTFRGSENFSVKGDFTALADRGKINSMETMILYPVGDPMDMIMQTQGMSGFGETYYSYVYGDEFSVLPVEEEEFASNLYVYERFVYDYYTSVPEEENRTVVNAVARLLDRVPEDQEQSFADITYRAKNNAYSRAYIASYLQDYFTSGDFAYSLTADNFSGTNSPLYNFLFETKAGHCAMYASSMCLMLRHFGVPARYVTGFTVGGENCAETADGYKYTVLRKNLHAWVEVYFDNVGWLPFDPTPGGGMSAYTPVGTSAAEKETTTASETSETTSETTSATISASSAETSKNEETTASASSLTEPDDPFSGGGNGEMVNYGFFRWLLLILGIPLAMFLTGMAAAGIMRSLNKKQNRKLKFFKSGESGEAVREMLLFSLKLLEINGVYRRSGETPEEFGFRADKVLKSGNVFREAVPYYERAEFCADPEFTKEEQLLVFGSVSRLLKITLDGMNGPKRFAARVKLFGKGSRRNRTGFVKK